MKKYDVVAVVGEYTDKERKIKSVFRNVGELHTREDGTEFLMMNKDFNLMAVRQKDPSSDKVFLSLFKPKEKDSGASGQESDAKPAASSTHAEQQFNDDIPF